MRSFYEELWRRLPDERKPPERERREAHLRSHARPGARALDLGCGDGTFVLAAPGLEWTGADIAEEALARARRRGSSARWVCVDEDGPLPFADGSFELVWCSETLEHVAHTAGFLAEARRVLAPGCALVLTVPDHPRVATALRALAGFERIAPPLGDHLRFYTGRSLVDVLDDAGLEEIAVKRSGPLLLASARRPG